MIVPVFAVFVAAWCFFRADSLTGRVAASATVLLVWVLLPLRLAAGVSALVIEGVRDWKTGTVDLSTFGLAALLTLLFDRSFDVGRIAAALLLAFAGRVASRRGLMGDGDGAAMALLPWCFGVAFGLQAVALGFIAGGTVAAIGLLTGRLHRGQALPLVPFLALGALVRCLRV